MKATVRSLQVSGSFIPARQRITWLIGCLVLTVAILFVGPAMAQPPALAWTNDVGASLFATDSSGNLYATTNGAVIILNSSGSITQSNQICPIAGLAQRDVAGNYYFTGSFAGTQDFGGITLVGGFVFNNNPPDTNFPTCYLAKYDSTGGLIWVSPYGVYSYKNKVCDFALNSDGSMTIAFTYTLNTAFIKFSSSGTILWQTNSPPSTLMADDIRITGISGTNGCFLIYKFENILLGGFYDPSGNRSYFNGIPPALPWWTNSLSWNGKPVPSTNGDAFMAGLIGSSPSYVPVLADDKAINVVLSSINTGNVEEWTLAGDSGGKIYLAGTDGSISSYAGTSALVWTTNYGLPVASMLIDNAGNRYIDLINGTIARLQSDPVPPPSITNAPVGGTIFSGSNFTFTVGASGYAPLIYQWAFQSNSMAPTNYFVGATNAAFTLTNATASLSGLYSVMISNVVTNISSTPVTLTVKRVEIFSGSQMLSGGSYSFSSPPTLTVASAFPSGEIFYTLDGSTPSFLSPAYTGPFLLTNSATVKAIGYSSDFSQSELADAVIVTVPPQFALTISTAGGGSVTLSPPGGSFTNATNIYTSNTLVTATAVPASGYTFLYWQGAATGSSSTASILMNQNQNLTAVFGTSFSTTVSGSGQVFVSPPSGPYPYGSVVRLEALPQSGNVFGAWGNAASGSLNPLYFTVTNPNPTVSSAFGTTPAGDASLTVLIRGKGKVSWTPSGNYFNTNQSVTLTATPDSGQSFSNWSGTISTTTANPVTVSMNQNQVIYADFSGQIVNLKGVGMTASGFQLQALGDPYKVCEIYKLTNAAGTNWLDLGPFTNTTGQSIFIDTTATNSGRGFYRARLLAP